MMAWLSAFSVFRFNPKPDRWNNLTLNIARANALASLLAFEFLFDSARQLTKLAAIWKKKKNFASLQLLRYQLSTRSSHPFALKD
ncbi:hypothetical protein T12_13743 [Trichinella patagoniensis]|uniref:Uncharacterized protein n=1 Tax=Trichinella patagoniensis TaxID=990121 RepID=A0A0V0ZEG6_9BILA|nr:hypothetical protein T12_13743 [Trichinella patagoniensis]